ncbi:unnamed protein product (macronuclear) [Paramecium tetraurelia]|uniref:Uncharacterized protein n=1 Tax=Paramecium tetraurelia TaxID=5888 RepID=A0CYZ6_PARTE|nr:uncharacterized protein GSPATT00011614001 [Paramecium tetraurelia]CAK76013.1 unnamed protein product [Paramecium tetraurelia]|eukprot:XP_001443410.1 hypothetical protein (macronuclear) [Paramecium tetraurelia strain d4-2]
MNYQKFRQNVDFYLKPHKEKLESPKEKSFVSPIRIKTQNSNQESGNKQKVIPISNMMDRINRVILDQRVKSPITTQRKVGQQNKENHMECFLKRQGCLSNYYKQK